jgi:hypothetical protein
MLQSSLSTAATVGVPLPAAIPAFVPEYAPLVLLAFLGTGFLLACCVLGGAIALAARRRGLAKALTLGAAAIAACYAALLIGAALLSQERTLAPGEQKYFCEMDCHVAYSIAEPVGAEGSRRLVTLRTWFDPTTIASFRGNAPLTPNPRVVYLVDERGRRLEPSEEATRAFRRAHGGSVPLDQPLRPGEAYSTTFVFEPPPGFGHPRLFVGDAPGPELLLIGHENSPFHGKVYFDLPPALPGPTTRG